MPNKNKTIQKLSQSVINQIAAGEIIERPNSVIKELLDNAIDAQANKINITIEQGGKKLIKITDNGVGIPKNQLVVAFEPHTTSKLTTLDDLNNLMTMGFRGEALATIKAVSKTTIASLAENETTGYKVEFNHKKNTNNEKNTSKQNETFQATPQKTAHNQGTTVIVENLFENIPARAKYLRTKQTEYRYILKTITPYFLIHPEIHFTFTSDNREVYNLPIINNTYPGTIHPSRIRKLIKSELADHLINFYYEGASIKIGGLSAHPSLHTKNTKDQYIFVNQRPVYDSGITRAVLQAYYRFIPKESKIPFFITINLNPNLIDFNVHPRKEKVKFINPYRTYSVVEQAVKRALEREVKEKFEGSYTSNDSPDRIGLNRLRQKHYNSEKAPSKFTNLNTISNQLNTLRGQMGTYQKTKSGKIRGLSFTRSKPSQAEIQQSLQFTKKILEENGEKRNTGKHFDNANIITNNRVNILTNTLTQHIPFQVFNKYIIIEQESSLWIIDQHAAAERITFEKLQQNLKSANSRNLTEETQANGRTITDSKVPPKNTWKKLEKETIASQTAKSTGSIQQQLLIPEEISTNEGDLVFLQEHIDFFESLGFEIRFTGKEKEATDEVDDKIGNSSINKGNHYKSESHMIKKKKKTKKEEKNDKQKAYIDAIPVLLVQSGYQKVFDEIFAQTDSLSKNSSNFETIQDDLLATIACHTSIRAGQKLHATEIQHLLHNLMACKNPYSCPHGRPLLWKIPLKELDKKFERG